MPIAASPPRVVAVHGGFTRAVTRSYPLSNSIRTLPFYRYANFHAAALVMPGKSAKERMLDYYRRRLDESRIAIIPPGVDAAFRPLGDRDAARREHERLAPGDEPLVLFVGKLSARRNIRTLLETSARMAASARIISIFLFHVGARSSEFAHG
jgi:glycosyltransferase involved in cell wall biosynthesis